MENLDFSKLSEIAKEILEKNKNLIKEKYSAQIYKNLELLSILSNEYTIELILNNEERIASKKKSIEHVISSIIIICFNILQDSEEETKAIVMARLTEFISVVGTNILLELNKVLEAQRRSAG